MQHRPSPSRKTVSAELAHQAQMLHAARTMPTDQGIAACAEYPDLYGRLAIALRPLPEDRKEAEGICSHCPLLKLCPVAFTSPGG